MKNRDVLSKRFRSYGVTTSLLICLFGWLHEFLLYSKELWYISRGKFFDPSCRIYRFLLGTVY